MKRVCLVLLLVAVMASVSDASMIIINARSFGFVDKSLIAIFAMQDKKQAEAAMIDAVKSGMILVFEKPTTAILLDQSLFDSWVKCRLINNPKEFYIPRNDIKFPELK